jgi:hypothetical protein
MRWKSVMMAAAVAAVCLPMLMAPARALAQGGGTILAPEDVQKLLPASLYYKGQAAPSQLRNSGGVKFGDGLYVLATLVDTSGYSSDVQAKYQAYFVTEVPLKIGGHSLPAGVYGVGFIGGGKFVVTDVGAHDVLTINSANDDAMKRPRPLQVTADPGGGYRLYAGRRYVVFSR